ncbi:MAG TPA: hypothetical protein PKA54_10020 [Chitinophagaceae bacterium]|nr:hypothetical protein [Chitinophagaceae bacterium]
MKKYTSFLILLLINISQSYAQKDIKNKKDPFTSTELWEAIPINRQLSHDKIDRLQKQSDEFDLKNDNRITIFKEKKQSDILTESILNKVDHLQIVIENLSLDHWGKIKYLSYLESNLKAFYNDYINGNAEANYYKKVIDEFEKILILQQNNEPLVPYFKEHSSKAIYANLNMYKDEEEATNIVYKKMVEEYPNEMLKKIYEFREREAAIDLMIFFAKQNPSMILNYATSTSFERNIVRKSKDPLVLKIIEIADRAKRPLRAIVFVDDLQNNQMDINQINTITLDNYLYYKALLNQRLKENELNQKLLDRECKEQALEYVRTMNELHDAQDAIRFKCIEPLSAKEIYFILVLCGDEIYTSTFVGAFNRMMNKIAPQKPDTFLEELKMDKFRTFIRMSAGYNKLSQFLTAIDEPNRNILMAKFVNNIDNNKSNELEDAVDVADAIGSIKDNNLVDYLLSQLKQNYERCYLENNKKGLIIYFLLHTLTVSIINPDETSEDLQNELKIPPIAFMPEKNLEDEKGVVVEQVYFYGDEDGKMSYNSFIANYKPDEWKINKTDKWVELNSIKGKPVQIFANLPLNEPEDEAAQTALVAHLEKNNISPAIVIHRGHSYHLPGTLKYLKPDNKIVILGSCGGYHNLSTILGTSEDAHIVSSKQTGTMYVTEPIINAVQSRLLAGKDINWIEIWSEVDIQLKSPGLIDKFNDYVPPHKNMGALFLKAFKIQMKEYNLM